MITLLKASLVVAASAFGEQNKALDPSSQQIQQIFSQSIPSIESQCKVPPTDYRLTLSCPDSDHAGYHSQWGPVYLSRKSEQDALENSEYARILNSFMEVLYRAVPFRFFLRKEEIEKADAILARTRDEILLPYAEYGCSVDNVWNRRNESLEESPEGTFRINDVEYPRVNFMQPIDQGAILNVGSNGLCIDIDCASQISLDIHEFTHVQLGGTVGLFVDFPLLVELIPVFEELIYNDLAYKKMYGFKEEEEVPYNKTITVWGKKFPLGEFTNVYRELKQSHATMSEAVLSPRSINYLTGIDFSTLGIQSSLPLKIMISNLEEIRTIIETTNLDLNSLSALSDEEKLKMIILNGLSADKLDFLKQLGALEEEEFLRLLNFYGTAFFRKSDEIIKPILEKSPLEGQELLSYEYHRILEKSEWSSFLLQHEFPFESVVKIFNHDGLWQRISDEPDFLYQNMISTIQYLESHEVDITTLQTPDKFKILFRENFLEGIQYFIEARHEDPKLISVILENSRSELLIPIQLIKHLTEQHGVSLARLLNIPRDSLILLFTPLLDSTDFPQLFEQFLELEKSIP